MTNSASAFLNSFVEQRSAERREEEAVYRQRASTIVNGQPFVGGMRIMDTDAEEILQIILEHYDCNATRKVYLNYEMIPKAYHPSISLELEKLNMYGVIASFADKNNIFEVTLALKGLTYFEDKTKAEGKEQLPIAENENTSRKNYDVFISHANRDKVDYVDELYLTLRKLGVRIFYDSEVISWGDNWKQAILNGTEKSEFAIIVISEKFFDREWTERELEELLKRQNTSGQKIVLPLLYGVSLEKLNEQYPFLSEIQMINTEQYSKEQITILFAKELIKRLR